MPKKRFRYHTRRLAGRSAASELHKIQRRLNRALRFLSLPGLPAQTHRVFLLVDHKE